MLYRELAIFDENFSQFLVQVGASIRNSFVAVNYLSLTKSRNADTKISSRDTKGDYDCIKRIKSIQQFHRFVHINNVLF